MEKHICVWTYWMGWACFVISVVWKLIEMLSGQPATLIAGQTRAGYQTAFHGAAVLFVASIATTGYTWMKSQKP
jgi:hypothetical protein